MYASRTSPGEVMREDVVTGETSSLRESPLVAALSSYIKENFPGYADRPKEEHGH